jgi:hypothetical protein
LPIDGQALATFADGEPRSTPGVQPALEDARPSPGASEYFGREGHSHARPTHDNDVRVPGKLVEPDVELVERNQPRSVDALALELEPTAHVEKEGAASCSRRGWSSRGAIVAASSSPRLWRMIAAMLAGGGV